MAAVPASLVSAVTATTAIANLLMVSPQDTVGYQPGLPPGGTTVGPPGIPPPPLLFHYEGEQSIDSETDITDHYVEDNTAVQDQIALKPAIISTHGFIGELNNVPPLALAILQAAANNLTAIGAYAPQLSSTAQLAYNEAFFIYQTATNAANALVSSWSSITGGGGQSVIGSNGLTTALNQNLQQTYFQQFFYYQQARILFTVQTPWAVFQNMAIWKLHPVQDADTNTITDFSVTFKQMRFAQTASSGLSNTATTQQSGQLSSQAAPNTNLGTSTPPESISLGAGASSMGLAGVA